MVPDQGPGLGESGSVVALPFAVSRLLGNLKIPSSELNGNGDRCELGSMEGSFWVKYSVSS